MIPASENKLIILDRDGVINEDSDNFIKTLDEWIPIPGSIEAIAALSKAGYVIAIATNQSGIGRGLFDLDELEKMHSKLNDLVNELGGSLAGIFYCPHTPEDLCVCRKPQPGLLDAIESELVMSVSGAYLVGDSLRDLEAGLSKHCLPVLVKTGKGQHTLEKITSEIPNFFSSLSVFDDLRSFANSVLAK